MLHSRLHREIQHGNTGRLPSRKPLIRRLWEQSQQQIVVPAETWALNTWQDRWNRSQSQLNQFVPQVSTKPTGCDLRRPQWVKLNRLRSGHGRYNSFLHRIGLAPSPNCTCGEPETAEHVLRCRVVDIQGNMTTVDDNFRDWICNTPLDI